MDCSWSGKRVHILRADSRVIRATVLKLHVFAHHVAVSVAFTEAGKRKRKMVSPTVLATMQLLWLNRDVVSEDDEDDDNNNIAAQVHIDLLPPLRLEALATSSLSIEQRAAVQFVVAGADAIVRLCVT